MVKVLQQYACKSCNMLARLQIKMPRNKVSKKYKLNYDTKAAQHKFLIGQQIFLSDTTAIGKNSKLSPNWIGPFEIIDFNDNNTKIKIKNKVKVVNIARIKPFMEEPTKCLSQDDSCSSESSQPCLSKDSLQGVPQRPMTRAYQCLQDLKNLANLAIAILEEEALEECYGNVFSENYDKNYFKNCRNGIRNFLHMPGLKKFLQKHYVPFENENGGHLLQTGNGVHSNKKADPKNLL
jgi:hypothetical protein